VPKKAAKVAEKMADKIIRESGSLTKSHGTRQQVIEMITPVAEAIAVLERAVRKYDRSFARLTEVNSRRLDELDPIHLFASAEPGIVPQWHPESS
jgi:hypothetical protein